MKFILIDLFTDMLAFVVKWWWLWLLLGFIMLPFFILGIIAGIIRLLIPNEMKKFRG